MAGEMWTRCIDSQFCRYDFRAPCELEPLPQRVGRVVDRPAVARRRPADAARSASCARRSARSAIARVSPSLEPGARFGPSRRLRRRPSGVRHRP